MQFGVCYFPVDYGIGPAEVAKAAEERGFSSLYFPEHTHIPTSRLSPYPGGGELPRMYAHTYDLFVASTAAAAATSTLTIGSGICLLIERDPLTTAKEVASVDRLSGGRFVFGIGAGWNREEMANHGTDARVRMRVMRERVLAMRALWTEDEAQFHGDYVDFDPVWSWPKPVQSPMPVYVGGMGPGVEDRILEYGDGWMAQRLGDAEEVAAFTDRLATLRSRATDAGRGAVPVSLFGGSPRPDMVRAYEDAGIDEVLFLLPDAGPDEVLPKLDQWAGHIR